MLASTTDDVAFSCLAEGQCILKKLVFSENIVVGPEGQNHHQADKNATVGRSHEVLGTALSTWETFDKFWEQVDRGMHGVGVNSGLMGLAACIRQMKCPLQSRRQTILKGSTPSTCPTPAALTPKRRKKNSLSMSHCWNRCTLIGQPTLQVWALGIPLINAFAAMSDDLSPIPRTHVMEGEHWLPKVVF